MKTLLKKISQHRFALAVWVATAALCISLLTRLALLIKSWSSVDFSFSNILGVFFLGILYDLVSISYLIIPVILYLWLVPEKIFQKKWNKRFMLVLFAIFLFGLFFNAIAEWLFWDEFNTRFNFIAVDYLIYTTEVVGNIRQSYPIEWIIVILLALTGGLTFLMRKVILTNSENIMRFKKRSVYAVGLLIVPVIFFFIINHKIHHFSLNALVNELSGNGLYELFAAYRNNELDYDQFYMRRPDTEAFDLIHKNLLTRETAFLNDKNDGIERMVTNEGPEKKLNVVLISVESFSAEFMRYFGNTIEITPFLDSLANHSLFFTNTYATGTRTVRGLEALSLCIPPTPGQSIVRRPNNEYLATLGSVFKSKGYESKYIYGGYSYFDNMGYYFGNNSYEVVDRSRIPESEIDYENIWGVADENLFELAEREIESTINKGVPVFAHVMTTSNHRPFTYPDGRIDIPSHTSRDGAVKYTDYSIGRFIKNCSKKPWFKNTVFMIVADHCASSAGKTELPINKYHIPAMIYSPDNITPQKIERLVSQIDLGPTLLGLLNFTYKSKFFGYDIFKLEPGRERAFISTYQSLGYLRHDTLVVLTPQKKVGVYIPDYSSGTATPVAPNEKLIHEAISWYQTASYQFKNNLLKVN